LVNFSSTRVLAVINKEFAKVRRDPTTLGLIMAVPVVLILLFCYAINLNPKHLPTAVLNYDSSPLTRNFIFTSLANSEYFELKYFPQNEAAAEKLMKHGDVSFVITIPSKFTRDLIHGSKPHLLLETDASTPGGMSGAVDTINILAQNSFNQFLKGSLSYLAPVNTNAYFIDQHARYNPNLITTHTIVPGLIGAILTLSLSLLTSIAITEEKEVGTIETLLNSPIQVLEIMIGKFVCYLMIGYIQLLVIVLLATNVLFNVPFEGSFLTLLIISLPFLMGNLIFGLTVSSIAQNQMQAQQMVVFYFLPSLLLSGFLFPFYGMPLWAQYLGNSLPLTHYTRIVIGLMLKGYTWIDIMPDLWPILVFLVLVTLGGTLTFRKTIA
jgi:ABC-2 type transport system permease protein